ncbi:MAG: rRNA maturation RNase YbeY [Bacteroidetes bacterium GWE2_41_25]|nr:MAG: rRNA maturation RNase YbeY [Bacteroidetes bacterium GWE2_41_25]OFY58859.1 MAG: rRNA maturation RNase YbeY [Bacteroidetes bacterium GWF2_41_9]
MRIYYDNTKYRFKGWRKTVNLIEKVIRSENMVSGDLSFIITSDEVLRKINIEFLNHNYYTDVIAFNYNDENIVKGEIYISKDTVKRNSHNYKVSLNNEMLRVMIHGILHLTGYNDKTEREREFMRRKEDQWLADFKG